MKKIALSLILFILFTSINYSQIKQGLTPNWVENSAYEIEPKIDINQIDQGSFLLLYDEQVNVKEQELFYRFVTKINDNVGVQNASSINVSYDPIYQTLTFYQIVIKRNGKIINKLNISNFQLIRRESNSDSYIYDGTLSAIMNISDVRKGDIIDYSYSIKGFNPIHNNTFSSTFYLNDFNPVGKINIRVISDKKLNYKTVNTKIKPSIHIKNGVYHYQWEKKDINGLEFENNTPAWKFHYETIFITEYKSWKEVIDWGVNVFKLKNPLSKELNKKIKEIENKNITVGDKINATLNFVQDEIRYLGLESGIGSYKPFSPKTVYKQRFGDCKDKSLLMVTMLNEMGIEAYPMLVNTYLKHNIKEVSPSPKHFDHCVVKVIDNHGNLFWYDPTISNQGGTYDKTYFPNYEFGLVLKKGAKEFDEIFSFSTNSVETVDEYFLDKIQGGATLTTTSKYYENEADIMRNYFKNNSINYIKKEFQNYYSNYFNNAKAIELPRFKDNVLKNEFIVYESYKIDSIWKTTLLNDKITASFQPTSITDLISLPNSRERKMPFELYFPATRSHKIKIHLPEEWNIKNESYDINSKGFYYDFDVNYNNTKKLLTLNHLLKIQKSYIPSKGFNSFFNQLKKMNNQISYSLIYPKLSSSKTSNWLYAIGQMLLIVSLLFAIWFAVKIYAHNPKTKIEVYFEKDKPLGGWLILIGILLCLSPLRIIYDLLDNDAIFLTGEWMIFFDQNAANFNFSLGIIIFFELLINVFLLVFSTLLIILFFKKRTSFPKLYSVLLIGYFIFITIDLTLVNYITYDNLEKIELSEILSSLIRTSVVVSYLFLSDRVKETFVIPLKGS